MRLCRACGSKISIEVAVCSRCGANVVGLTDSMTGVSHPERMALLAIAPDTQRAWQIATRLQVCGIPVSVDMDWLTVEGYVSPSSDAGETGVFVPEWMLAQAKRVLRAEMMES